MARVEIKHKVKLLKEKHDDEEEKKFKEGTAFVALLKACAKRKDLSKGTKVHAEVRKRGLLESNPYIFSSLVSMYAKCGDLEKAQESHDEVPFRNVASWSVLISMYARCGQGKRAFDCFNRMKCESLTPNVVTFIGVLSACGNVKAIGKGKQIHDEITRTDFLGSNLMLGNALVDMYAKCGELMTARQVLNGLPFRDEVTWNALISKYTQLGHGEEALSCFYRMKREGLSPTIITFTCILKACGSIGLLEKGKEIHDEIRKKGLLRKDIMVGNALIDMYVKCGVLFKAQEVVDELPYRDVVSWNTIISGYAQQGKAEEALSCFNKMQYEGIYPDFVTYTCVLKACSSKKELDKGKQMHEEILRKGLLLKHNVLGHALANMYARCTSPTKAHVMLHELPVRDVVSWSALLSGYVQQGYNEEALASFKEMQMEGILPNAITFASLLKACGSTGDIETGKRVHEYILSKGCFRDNVVLGNALIHMYIKCNALDKALEVFDEILVRDIVSWNILISGYAQKGQDMEALKCFELLRRESFLADEVTLTCILKACGNIGALDKGEQIHEQILRRGLLENNVILGGALIDMYAKCGAFMKAQQLLNELPMQGVIPWSALIQGYTTRGNGDEALHCFDRMLQDGITPNSVSFLSLLSSCSHSGLVDEGQMFFANMRKNYGITPTIGHYICMVDLFGRVGHFDKVMDLIKEMPSPDYLPIWGALLGACRKWGNVRLGRLAFDRAIQLDSRNVAAYVSMVNIYAAAGMKEDVETIETMRMHNCK